MYGHHVLDACRTLGFAVPEEVAVIVIEAAALLDRLMRGEGATMGTRLVPTKGVATRQSTDSIADRVVARAVRFIRENANRPIGVDDVLSNAGVSRSTLERRLRAVRGRSPHDEIGRVRIKRVQSLLEATI